MKRLTDTLKWNNPWFRKLPTKYKLLFLYMLDTCDNAGVMHLDFDLINFSLKEKFLPDDFKKFLGEKVIFISSDKIIIKSFIRYQQGSHTNCGTMSKHICKLIDNHGIKKLIKEHGLWDGYA